LLFAYDEELDLALEPFDRVVIPVYRPTVTVTGAVTSAGQFPYNPGQPYTYYIGLAGGIDTEMNSNGAASVKDATGNTKPMTEGVAPGDTVYVHRNSFLYNFNRFFPLVTSALTLVSAAFSIYSFVDGLQQP
jgi:protein involved in polysaccharide export with SLBB domain